MLVLFKATSECVRSYKRSTKGFEAIKEVDSLEEGFKEVERWENSDFFPQEDGSVTDAFGGEIFDPKYPTEFEFGDYYYRIIDTKELDEEHDSHKIQALKEANIEF